MKVSLITVSFNSKETIEETIQSVLSQLYPDIEYILVDGCSTDGTLDIIKQYENRIARIITEKDDGIYDALNKGIEAASGELVGILHADDLYSGNTSVAKVVEKIINDDSQALYGDLVYVDRLTASRIIRHWKSCHIRDNLFLNGWMPPHPTFFVKKDVYLKYGLFNTALKTSADYELMLRFLHKFKIKVSYLPEVIVKMRMGGASNQSFLNRIKANIEDRKAWRMNGLKPGTFTFIRKPLSKLGQYYLRNRGTGK